METIGTVFSAFNLHRKNVKGILIGSQYYPVTKGSMETNDFPFAAVLDDGTKISGPLASVTAAFWDA